MKFTEEVCLDFDGIKTLLNHAREFETFTLYYNPTLSEHGLNFGNRKSSKAVHFRKILH